MKGLYPILVGLIGLLAVGATLWILFLGESEEDLPSGGRKPLEENTSPAYPQESPIPPVEPGADAPSLEVPKPRLQVEEVLPDFPDGVAQAGLKIQVLHRKGNKLLPPEEVSLKVFYYDHPLNRIPKYEKSTGEYVLDDLLPGHYKASARTMDWASGRAAAKVEPGGYTYMNLFLDQPRHLQIQVVDGVTHAPVRNAQLEIPGFIDGGLTDEQGFFQSVRKWTPDTELVLRISHPSYFTTLFEPLKPEKCGAKLFGKEQAYRVPLSPKNGDLEFTGVLKDHEGNPLPRWTLILRENDESGRPLARRDQVPTDSNGSFRFAGLRPGTYVVTGTIQLLGTSRIPYPPFLFEETVVLSPGQSLLDHTLVCQRDKQPFCGRVFMTETRRPAAGIKISYRPSRGRFNRSSKDRLDFDTVTTDENGAFRTQKTFLPEDIFRLLLTGSLELTNRRGQLMQHRPMQSYSDIRQLQADIVRQFPLILWTTEKGDVKLIGQVVDKQGVPLPQVRVSAFSGTGIFQGHHRGFTDATGRFEIPRLYPGEWLVRASLPNGPSLEESISIPPDQDIMSLTMKVTDNCLLEGEIKTDQTPDRMTILVKGLDFETERIPIGSDLWYSFRHLPEGKARVVLEVYSGKRFYENNLKVMEAWVDLKPGVSTRKDFTF